MRLTRGLLSIIVSAWLVTVAASAFAEPVLAMDGVPGPPTAAPTDPPTDPPTVAPTGAPTAVPTPAPSPSSQPSPTSTAAPDPPSVLPTSSEAPAVVASPIPVIAPVPALVRPTAHPSLPPTDTAPGSTPGPAFPIGLLALAGLVALTAALVRLAPAFAQRRR